VVFGNVKPLIIKEGKHLKVEGERLKEKSFEIIKNPNGE
jgi:hypothetical protein